MTSIHLDLEHFSFTDLAIQSAFGLAGLIFVLLFHGVTINFILMRFNNITRLDFVSEKFNLVLFHFYLSFAFIALIHIIEVILWALMLLLLGLVLSPIEAILFAGSTYTTIGFISNIMPFEWKVLPLFIAFSGLFSIAWTTSIMIGMTNIYRDAWLKKRNDL